MSYLNLIHKSWQLAWAPANFAVNQNVKMWKSLAGSNQYVEHLDQQWMAAQEQAFALIRDSIEKAEQSIPSNIESFSETQRQNFVLGALENAQLHLLAAIGEIYKAARVLNLESGQVIEHAATEKNLPAYFRK